MSAGLHSVEKDDYIVLEHVTSFWLAHSATAATSVLDIDFLGDHSNKSYILIIQLQGGKRTFEMNSYKFAKEALDKFKKAYVSFHSRQTE